MKRMQIIIFQLLIFFSALGQDHKTIEFDFDAFALKDSINGDLTFEQTVNEIERYCSTDTQRICLIAGWIYDNIAFDLAKFYEGGAVNNYKTVFDIRKGICGDYSSLFSAFCDQLNVENEIIEGYAPEYDSENKVYYETNHAWNIVRVGDNWYHCDLLGFSGFLKKDSSNDFVFVKQPNTNYILTQELSFISQRIPADPIWQLSNYPISLDSLLAHGVHAEVDTSGMFVNYEKEIANYVNLSKQNKLLTFADNAYRYNKNNSNVLVINNYNASVELITSWKGDKQKLMRAKKYLEKAAKHAHKATNGAETLRSEIERTLVLLKKYVP